MSLPSSLTLKTGLPIALCFFERSWSNAAIDHIQITVAEDLGVEGRGNYYDDTGGALGLTCFKSKIS